jgi:hypothetical protein
MNNRDRYRDRPATASDGEAFARLCIKLHLDFMGEDVGYYETAREQIELGESRMGVEFKHLQKSYERFRIEIAERKTTDDPWFPSGIFAKCKRYVCGNEDDIWAFDVRDLRQLVNHRSPDHPMRMGETKTIYSYELEKADAAAFYRYRFVLRDDGRYKLLRRGFAGYDGAGRFVAYCHCGEEAPFGYDCFPGKGQMGTHYCREHKPK